ncbi:MAG: helix-turn-helix domain-containing protein [Spirochaetales bacterium]|nr:helix-turn-helix domain-containing protein [Spirochaetales bacterium]
MAEEYPFYKNLPYRNIILDLTMPPFPQENGEDWDISNRTMNDYDLFVCEQGSALFTIDGVNYRLKAGMGLLVPPDRLVNARKTSLEPLRMVAQHFMLYLFQSTDFFSHIKYDPLVQFPSPRLLFSLTDEIRRIVEGGRKSWSPLDTGPLFMVILKEFLDGAYRERDVREERKSSLVLEMIRRIDRDFTDPLLLDRLMERSPYGYSHTANMFKEYTGRSLKSFIIDRRMEAGKEALLRGDSLTESAEAAGYEDGFYFSRIFKKYTGLSPRDFKNRI